MDVFPAFFPLAGRRVVLAGEGDGAEARARLLAGSPAQVERVAGEAALRPKTYAGVALAFVASPDLDFCIAAAAAAREVGAPVNVTDHPELSDFHTPALIDRGQVVAAVGTSGAAPILAALVRAELEAHLPPEIGPLARLFGELRADIRAAFPDLARRRAFLRAALAGPVAEAARAGDLDAARSRLTQAIAEGLEPIGRIGLIEAPEARDRLSLSAARALAEADLVVHDQAVSTEVLALARRDAPRRALAGIDAAALAALAAEGRQGAVLGPEPALRRLEASLRRLDVPIVYLKPAPAA